MIYHVLTVALLLGELAWINSLRFASSKRHSESEGAVSLI